MYCLLSSFRTSQVVEKLLEVGFSISETKKNSFSLFVHTKTFKIPINLNKSIYNLKIVKNI